MIAMHQCRIIAKYSNRINLKPFHLWQNRNNIFRLVVLTQPSRLFSICPHFSVLSVCLSALSVQSPLVPSTLYSNHFIRCRIAGLSFFFTLSSRVEFEFRSAFHVHSIKHPNQLILHRWESSDSAQTQNMTKRIKENEYKTVHSR